MDLSARPDVPQLRHNHPFPGPVTVHCDSRAELTAAVRNYRYADAYRVTPPWGVSHGPQVWRGALMSTVVEWSMRVPPVGWFRHHATFRPTGVIDFTGGSQAPWAPPMTIWSAEPVSPLTDWGPHCVRCGAFGSEHAAWPGPWLYRGDGTACGQDTFTAA
jgi:hypothetical protein